jgi:hypothetical protein
VTPPATYSQVIRTAHRPVPNIYLFAFHHRLLTPTPVVIKYHIGRKNSRSDKRIDQEGIETRWSKYKQRISALLSARPGPFISSVATRRKKANQRRQKKSAYHPVFPVSKIACEGRFSKDRSWCDDGLDFSKRTGRSCVIDVVALVLPIPSFSDFKSVAMRGYQTPCLIIRSRIWVERLPPCHESEL